MLFVYLLSILSAYVLEYGWQQLWSQRRQEKLLEPQLDNWAYPNAPCPVPKYEFSLLKLRAK